MTDHKDGRPSRDGFGDDQGTRVGSPDPGRARDDTQLERDADAQRPTGAGAEAAEGIHGAQGRVQNARTGVSTPRGTDESPGTTDSDRAGSEPLRERQDTHKSGYGGEMGEPKTSSDDRR